MISPDHDRPGMDEMTVKGLLRTSVLILLLIPFILPGCSLLTSRISIYDRFLVSEDNIITDIVTGLQWKVGPNRDFDWFEAGIWVASLGGNWRLPYHYELEELYAANISTLTWGPFDNTGRLVWSVDFTSRNMSHLFSFAPYDVYSGRMSVPSGQRVFAVLSPPGYWINAQRTFRSLILCGFPLFHLYSG